MLTQIQGFFNEAIRKEIAVVHAAAQPYVQKVTEGFNFPRPLRDVIWRSGLRKEHDTLGTILHLVQSKRSGIALPLLRPMCEDLLFLRYIGQLPEATAEKIISLGAQREMLQSMLAQSGGDDNVAWLKIGTAGKQSVKESLAKIEAELAKEGKQLGWRNGSYWPSAAHVANNTGMTNIYDQIYHGTSRGVHFSPHHLLRMVWGRPEGTYTATLENFEHYYEAYTVGTAGSLFCSFIDYCWGVADLDPEESLKEQVIKLKKMLGDFGNVPIVTVEELMFRAT